MMESINQILIAFVNFVWGMPLLILLLGGGVFFAIYSRLIPYRHFGHGIKVIRGKYDNPDDEGDLTHAQALAAALSGTIGLGNIAGVAIAITSGGPGAIFWMWVTAILGVATKFFTCTLGVMYRGRDSQGHVQGGPMYVVQEGLGKKFYPLAILFAVAGLFGTIPSFQANQLTAAIREELLPAAWITDPTLANWIIGIVLAAIVAGVVFGGLKRVSSVALRLVPTMTLMYIAMTLFVLLTNITAVPAVLGSIFVEAFTAEAVGGGLLGMMIIGISRGAFSNEAGIGTEVMAHGAAKTNEPVREGLVGMMGPVIDTLIVCTCTALVILITGVWTQAEGMQGVTLTMSAYGQEMGTIGQLLLGLQVLFLSLTTMFTFWYYGAKCLGFLVGAQYQHYYQYFYVGMVVVGALTTLDIAFNLIIGMYALMAIPTMTAAILLAPKVMEATRDYFQRFDVKS